MKWIVYLLRKLLLKVQKEIDEGIDDTPYEEYQKILSQLFNINDINFMKELSIEEKAKAYDKVIGRANSLLSGNQLGNAWIYKLLPELAESEDERIRKEIVRFIQMEVEDEKVGNKWIDWLKKQGKQILANPAKTCKDAQETPDKVEPMFKVGDWLMSKHFISKPFCITKIHKTNYYLTNQGSFIKFNEEDNYRLWTIHDAKEGDVLATLNHILIFKEFLKNDGGISYCHYDFGARKPQFVWFEDKNWYFGEEAIVHPATKEQRDLFFQKMKEAGYEWDAENKQLKKVEQEELTEFENIVKELADEAILNDYGVKELANRLLSNAKKQLQEEFEKNLNRHTTRLTRCNSKKDMKRL